MTREQIEEEYQDCELLFADGFDEAILGVAQRFNSFAVCYDRGKCIEILCERDGMNPEEADEYFDFNVVGAYVGEATPIFLMPSYNSEDMS